MPRNFLSELRDVFSANSMARNPILGKIDPRDMAQGLSATQPMPPAAANALFGFVPGVGDAIGLGQDMANYAADPGSRNWLNYGLSAAALIPGFPNLPKVSQRAKKYVGMELVSLDDIMRYADEEPGIWDGLSSVKRDSKAKVADLAKRFSDGEEIQEPLKLAYDPRKGAYLQDGNHRAHALKQAGFTHVPVIVDRANLEWLPGKPTPAMPSAANPVTARDLGLKVHGE
jgi:hypothetical protein